MSEAREIPDGSVERLRSMVRSADALAEYRAARMAELKRELDSERGTVRMLSEQLRQQELRHEKAVMDAYIEGVRQGSEEADREGS